MSACRGELGPNWPTAASTFENRGLRLGQHLPGVANQRSHLFQRQPVNLLVDLPDHAGQRCLQIVAVARQRRNIARLSDGVQLDARGGGEEVHRHESLAGEQARRTQLRPQPVVDEPAHPRVGRQRELVESAAQALAQAVGIDAHIDRRRELEGHRVVVEADAGHLAERQAAEFDRRPNGQPAHGLMEDERVLLGLTVRPLHRVAVAPVEEEVVPGWRGSVIGLGLVGPGLEGDAPEQQRHQRLGLDLDAGGIHRGANPARLPESRARRDEAIERRAHEHANRDMAPVRLEIRGGDLPDLQVTEVIGEPAPIARAARATNSRPLVPPLTTGTSSRPAKCRRARFEVPTSTPMYAPESKVSSPDTSAAATRARTTQKCVSSTIHGAASRFSSAVTSTVVRSALTPMSRTSPTSTSRYRIFVLPATRPPGTKADGDHRPARADGPDREPAADEHGDNRDGPDELGAEPGMPHHDRLGQLRVVTHRPHRWQIGIPDETRVERARRQHRQHDDRAERDRRRSHPDCRQAAQLHQRADDRRHEDVGHRPPADPLDQTVKARALEAAPRQRRWTDSNRAASTSNFASGIRTLAIRMTTASGHDPSSHKATTPLRIVSRRDPNGELVSRIGSRLAGA